MRTFLQAEWRKLAMANYAVDKKLLDKYVPPGTEIDLWNGTCYVSLVGFMFNNTKLKGFRIPYHIDFEEVNLRFYVRYKDKEEWKRGVVFVKEIVPRPALTFVANTFYKEKYETMPMSHEWARTKDELRVEYRWKKKQWNFFQITANLKSEVILPDSEEEFITEHYWGYTKVSRNQTAEYKVDHPRWEVYPTSRYEIHVDFHDIYGSDFEFLGSLKPSSVFLAEGSEIKVFEGRRI